MGNSFKLQKIQEKIDYIKRFPLCYKRLNILLKTQCKNVKLNGNDLDEYYTYISIQKILDKYSPVSQISENKSVVCILYPEQTKELNELYRMAKHIDKNKINYI